MTMRRRERWRRRRRSVVGRGGGGGTWVRYETGGRGCCGGHCQTPPLLPKICGSKLFPLTHVLILTESLLDINKRNTRNPSFSLPPFLSPSLSLCTVRARVCFVCGQPNRHHNKRTSVVVLESAFLLAKQLPSPSSSSTHHPTLAFVSLFPVHARHRTIDPPIDPSGEKRASPGGSLEVLPFIVIWVFFSHFEFGVRAFSLSWLAVGGCRFALSGEMRVEGGGDKRRHADPLWRLRERRRRRLLRRRRGGSLQRLRRKGLSLFFFSFFLFFPIISPCVVVLLRVRELGWCI